MNILKPLLLKRLLPLPKLTHLISFSYQKKLTRIRRTLLSENNLQPFTMDNLYDNHGARKRKQIKGRGPGCKKGKTSGRGHKGQYARSGGKVGPAFEGGQTPISMRLPKFGRTRSIQNRPGYVNMSKLIEWVQKGRIDHTKKIDIFTMVQTGLISKDKAKYGVKLLCRGDIHFIGMPLQLELSDASEKAITLIKQEQGQVNCIYRTPLQIQEQINPKAFRYHLEAPLPSKRRVMKLINIHKRGAEVSFKQPQWLIDQGGFESFQEQKQEDTFEYPAQRTPGCGADKIRKRKSTLWKPIDILPDNTFQ